eukprot:4956035-Pyramimonas_sp.AAC.1
MVFVVLTCHTLCPAVQRSIVLSLSLQIYAERCGTMLSKSMRYVHISHALLCNATLNAIMYVATLHDASIPRGSAMQGHTMHPSGMACFASLDNC